jgi:hypothetical protein
MALTKRFVALPDIPHTGLVDWQGPLFHAMKENIELLTDTRGEPGGASAAITRADVQVNELGTQGMHTVNTSKVDGFEISGSDVAGLESHRALRNDVQQLANDLVRTRETLDFLIKSMKG